MTEISFHTKVPDVMGYACRLLRKASRKGSRVVVSAESDVLRQLDLALWTFDELDFVPHIRVARGATVAPRLAATPIWLIEPGTEPTGHDVLVNLSLELPPGFAAYERVIEIVGHGDEVARAGRARWRHYLERGYALKHHEAVND